MSNSTVPPGCNTIEESIGFHEEPKTETFSTPPPFCRAQNRDYSLNSTSQAELPSVAPAGGRPDGSSGPPPRKASATRPLRGGALRALGVAVLACAVLLTGLLAAGSASAQTSDITTPTENADGSDTLWRATLTVEEFISATIQVLGYDKGNSKGTLSSDSFTIEGTDYLPDRLAVEDSPHQLQFWERRIGFPAEKSNWVLYLDETAFHASDADTIGLTKLDWNNPSLNWADSDSVSVRLVRLNAPEAPTNLTAQSVANTQINLSWSAPSKTGGSDITGYKIEVSTDGGSNYIDLVADTESVDTEYSHKGLTSGNTRHYRVSAINDIGTGAVSNEDSATAMSPAGDITTPTENADGSDTLWRATLTVEEFISATIQVLGYDKGNSKGTLSSDSFTIEGTDYLPDRLAVEDSPHQLQFWERRIGFPAEKSNWVLYLDETAFHASDADTIGLTKLDWNNPSLNWADSDSVSVRLVRLNAPEAPTNLTAQSVANTRINLSWSAPSKTGGSDITGYKIEVSTDGGSNYIDLVADTASTDTEYSHKGLPSGATRHYRVSAINDIGTGAVSNEDSATAMSPAGDITTPTANRDGSDTLWRATLTVEEFISATIQVLGYDKGNSKGTLSSDSFTIEGTDYLPDRLAVEDSPHQLQFWERRIGFPAEKSNWVLYLDETAFHASDADTIGLTKLDWNNPSLNWADSDSVSVRLVRLNAPEAPRNLYARGVSSTQIDLTWREPEKSGGDISGYKIEVSTDGGNNWSDLVADTSSTDTTYSHTNLTSGATRHYRVSAINAAGTSPVSDVASATAEVTAPGLASAVVERTNSLAVRLNFDWVIDTTSVPDKSAFAVKVRGKSRTVTSFTVTDGGRLGWVGLASRVRPGETVTLSYTKPGMNPIKDASNLEMASFTDYSVTNETSNDFPVLSMEAAEVHESGTPGVTSAMIFTVGVDTEPDFPVGVHYETEDVTATGGASCSGSSPPDYISTEGRLTLGPGESSKEVEVTVCDDSVEDSGETFRLVLRSTQLHESISELGTIGPEGKSYKDENGEDEETASQTGTILNDETTTEVSIAADAAYTEEGAGAVFTLRRAGDAEGALTVPVTVEETGAMLGAEAPANAEFAAGARETELRVPTDDDGANESDSTVTATLQTGADWLLAEGADSAALTVLDNDAAPVTSVSASDVTVWSADMTVVDYENGNIGAGSADLLANQGGSAGLRAKWLYYVTGARKLKIAFGEGLDDAESMTLHVGDVSVAFPENSGGDSSFTIEDVDASWADGETLAARVSKPSAEAVSTDATLKSLVISDVAVSPVFDAGTLLYTAVVDSATASVTVSAESNDGDAEVAFVPSEDADSEQEGHQVAVPVGEALATVTVTAADGETQRAYRVIVKRWPTVAVSFGSESHTATESGDAASVIVELDADPGRDVTIPLTASPVGGAAAEDYAVPGSVTFTRGGALSQGVVVTAVADDTAEEGESVVLGFGDFPDGVEAGATTSAAVTLADAPPVNTAPTGLPSITGTPQVGEILTASVTEIVDANGIENATFEYQWVSNNGTSDSDIEDATESTYTLVTSDAGKTIKVRVTFTDDGGTQEVLTSAATDVVNTAPTGLPSITGTPQVGEILTASVTEIVDANGIENATFEYQWVSNNGTSDSDIEDATESTYTLAASDAGKTIKVRVTFTDDGGTRETLTSAATDAVTISLTASFEDVPDEHDGSSRFTFRVRFNVEPRVGYKVLRDESFAVTGGVVKKARRVDGRNDLREIHIDPLGWGDVTVTLPGGRACGTEGAICTADGKVLSNTETATVQGPPALNVADARVEEGGDATLDFVVTLSRAASRTVTVDYATSDDTATAGADYTTASGTLTFAAGTTEQRVSVPVLDDAIDDGGETLTLTLSNASGAWIEDGAATGTIENSDPMPKAWLARFGRTVASQAVEALEERMAQPQGVTRLNLGGGVSGFYGEAPAQGKAEIFIEEESEGNWGSEDAAHNPVEVSPEAVLLGSSFHLAVADLDEQGRAVPGPWAIWGRGATTRFEGTDGDLSIDGNVSTGMLGADYRWGRMMFGTAVSRSVSDGDFTLGGELGGSVESSLTAAYPYLRVSATERLSLWGMLGYGKGSMSLEDMGSADIKTDISMKMGAFGARGDILSGEKGLSLAVKSEALWVRVESDSVAGLVSVEADASRIRAVVEGGFAFPVGSGVFTPLVEAGLRHDGGDAETGFGAEVGGGLRYSNSALGLDMEFTARRLVAHGDEDYGEWGLGGSARFNPRSSRKGFQMSLRTSSSLGDTQSGVERLWTQREAVTVSGLGQSAFAGSLDAEVGYGVGAFSGRGVLVPYTGFGISREGDRGYKVGGRIDLGPSFSLVVEGDRRETYGTPAVHGVTLKGSRRW